ncbi:hypothetical protein TELCIR_20455, partial [Teladorsagia circumcincta]
KGHKSPCLCAPSRFCVAYNGKTPPIEIWTYLKGGPPTEDPNFLEAMGFQGMTDEVAIVTKAKENIMFAMATLSMEDREKLSTTKRELVQKCSFNGKACDIDACQQPCRQSIYSVTYSPAKWPSLSLQIQLGSCNGTNAECNKHYKENGAMVEVFYEQLNFEMLTESEAYG